MVVKNNINTIPIIISISLMLIRAIIGIYFPDHQNAKVFIQFVDALIVGMLTYVVSMVYSLSNRIENMNLIPQVNKELIEISSIIKAREKVIKNGDNSFDLYWAICLLKARSGIYDLKDSNTFEVSENLIPNFWIQAINNTDFNWLCTSYVITKTNWKEGWTKMGIESQKLGIGLKSIGVKRIFIFDNSSDANDIELISLMKKHLDYGIKVRWISLDKKIQWEPLDCFAEKIGTVDMALIDGKYLFSFFQNSEDKHFTSIRCTSNNYLVSEISIYYNRLWDGANEISELKSAHNNT
ncbi:MAG: hypothetical protein MI974_14855 [Chitinophagales bacterium]|nr:hypothetical protein [Chitinophagales bacterium]